MNNARYSETELLSFPGPPDRNSPLGTGGLGWGRAAAPTRTFLQGASPATLSSTLKYLIYHFSSENFAASGSGQKLAQDGSGQVGSTQSEVFALARGWPAGQHTTSGSFCRNAH